MSELPQQQQEQQQQQRNRNILPNGEPDHQRDGLLFNQSIERKREKNKIAARIKRSRKKQRLEALELRERELSERRRQLENELRMSRLANCNILLRSSSNADNSVGAADGDDGDNAAAASVEARTEALQVLCNQVRAVCVQAQGAIDALTNMRRELSALFDDLE
ncbi:hypothetical protein GGI19_005163 [Coemansia pectinata]|uniref:BZIP domain-containing protein n=1 Tax=Coemansia pectinata TaxID=1052879 RepID=A0A9W8L9L1_9FUNG|nr:hypothetical protein GGI19_005163 [Coemansia pectinata]